MKTKTIGRPSLPLTKRTVVTAVRLTPAYKKKFLKLGRLWLIEQIDLATKSK